jgi:acyl-CoA reductase-like NAD-dependent aldehyde dehydrogenase
MDGIMDGEMKWKFVNEQHEKTYREAVAMLDAEDVRQGYEARKLFKEWERLPEQERMEKMAWLQRHFIACREPYIKLVADILALATPVMIVTKAMVDEQITRGGKNGD